MWFPFGISKNVYLTVVFSSQVAEWIDEDYAALAKAMSKFPGGTPGRWERIAHELGRRADEVSRIIVRGISGAQHSSKTARCMQEPPL